MQDTQLAALIDAVSSLDQSWASECVRALKELRVRRKQMTRIPFCPDHRDKVFGMGCRECEIERQSRVIRGLTQLEETS